MNDRHADRLTMFRTCLRTLEEHQEVWQDKSPRIFTQKVSLLAEAVSEIEATERQRQRVATSGLTSDKQREEVELEDAAFVVANLLSVWYTDREELQYAHQTDLSASEWRKMRKSLLLEKARHVHELGQTVVSGQDAEAAADYGITQAELDLFGQEIESYADLSVGPQQLLAEQKALTAALDEKFRAASRLLDVLDKLVPMFARHRSAGRAFVAAFQGSRVIRDSGKRTTPTRELAAAAATD